MTLRLKSCLCLILITINIGGVCFLDDFSGSFHFLPWTFSEDFKSMCLERLEGFKEGSKNFPLEMLGTRFS